MLQSRIVRFKRRVTFRLICRLTFVSDQRDRCVIFGHSSAICTRHDAFIKTRARFLEILSEDSTTIPRYQTTIKPIHVRQANERDVTTIADRRGANRPVTITSFSSARRMPHRIIIIIPYSSVRDPTDTISNRCVNRAAGSPAASSLATILLPSDSSSLRFSMSRRALPEIDRRASDVPISFSMSHSRFLYANAKWFINIRDKTSSRNAPLKLLAKSSSRAT